MRFAEAEPYHLTDHASLSLKKSKRGPSPRSFPGIVQGVKQDCDDFKRYAKRRCNRLQQMVDLHAFLGVAAAQLTQYRDCANCVELRQPRIFLQPLFRYIAPE